MNASSLMIGNRTMAGGFGNSASGRTWYDREAQIHGAALPNILTESVAVQCGVANVGEAFGTNALDAAKEGGAIKGNNAAWTRVAQPTVYQSLVTSRFAVSFQGSFAAMAVAKSNYFGLVNVAGSQGILIGTGNDTDPVNFIAFAAGAGVTPTLTLGVADTSVYTWRIIMSVDGSLVTVSRSVAAGGGAVLNSGTISTAHASYPTGTGAPGLYANVVMSGQGLYKVLYSFVGPG